MSPQESNALGPSGDGWLLTGCTGLVGRFVLRDLLVAGNEVCVLVRGKRGLSALERVESIIQHFENELQQHLIRPKVIDVDLTRKNFVVDENSVSSMRHRFANVLHCAASVRFDFDMRRVEPVATNIDGTRNIIRFAETLGVENFHHVSTAFVCGNVQDKAYEKPIPASRSFRNPYEYSKAVAERLVLQSSFKTKTVYRPSIVVGRLHDGWANSFHTLYALLRFARDVGTERLEHMMDAVGLSQTHLNNVVPVDWVVDCIKCITGQPQTWGKIYNLTSNFAVKSADIMSAIRIAAAKDPDAWKSLPTTFGKALNNVEQDAFELHAKVFMRYFHSDLDFVNESTCSVPGIATSPRITVDDLTKAFLFAIRAKFNDPTLPATRSANQQLEALHSYLAVCEDSNKNKELHPSDERVKSLKQTKYVHLCLAGQGGGCWWLPTLRFENSGEIHLPVWLMIRLIKSDLCLDQALSNGLIQSNLDASSDLKSYLLEFLEGYRQFSMKAQENATLADASRPEKELACDD